MKRKSEGMATKAFDRLFKQVCNWGRWGKNDERGTLNYIRPRHIRRAASLVKKGVSVSLAIPLNKTAGPDNPQPIAHYMARNHDVALPKGNPGVAMDYLGCVCHSDCFTHVDALCHISYRGKLYNGRPVRDVASVGAECLDVDAYATGIVGRGVLLDIPRLRNVKWLEPGTAVTAGELIEAEKAQGVRLAEGDIFLFRTGHHRRRLELGPWNAGFDGEGRAGLALDAIPLLHARKVAAFLPDGDGDTVPCNVEGVSLPIHTLQITAMGMACADCLQLEDLARACAAARRWAVMVVAAPLRLPGGTGTLFNPIAVL
ncbi:MAG: cyclase family protein [Kiritimatiellae bacterium]|nr:cyclase family protein [Kiritimatiellia bacterium]